MSTYSSILVCEIPWTEEPDMDSWDHKELDTSELLKVSLFHGSSILLDFLRNLSTVFYSDC